MPRNKFHAGKAHRLVFDLTDFFDLARCIEAQGVLVDSDRLYEAVTLIQESVLQLQRGDLLDQPEAKKDEKL